MIGWILVHDGLAMKRFNHMVLMLLNASLWDCDKLSVPAHHLVLHNAIANFLLLQCHAKCTHQLAVLLALQYEVFMLTTKKW